MKNLLSRLALITITFLLVGCYTTVKYEIKTPFNEREAAAVLGKGSATISGQVFMRRNDGMVVKGAGSKVTLYANTEFVREGFRAAKENLPNVVIFSPDPPGWPENYQRVVEADGDGNFSFTGVPDGDYVLRSRVIWYAGNVPQGGDVWALTKVNGGRNVKLNVRKLDYELMLTD